MKGKAGSYTEDPVTGVLTLVERTGDAPRPGETSPPPAPEELPAVSTASLTEE